jgi:Fe-S-cluster containining protein
MTDKLKLFKQVPCGKCVTCCQRVLIFLCPSDIFFKYKTKNLSKGITVLQQKENGDCIYLKRNFGCTIYQNRPLLCQHFDCREAVKMPREHPKEILQAAKKCNKRSINNDK